MQILKHLHSFPFSLFFSYHLTLNGRLDKQGHQQCKVLCNRSFCILVLPDTFMLILLFAFCCNTTAQTRQGFWTAALRLFIINTYTHSVVWPHKLKDSGTQYKCLQGVGGHIKLTFFWSIAVAWKLLSVKVYNHTWTFLKTTLTRVLWKAVFSQELSSQNAVRAINFNVPHECGRGLEHTIISGDNSSYVLSPPCSCWIINSAS